MSQYQRQTKTISLNHKQFLILNNIIDFHHNITNVGGGALGHPKVMINLEVAGPHACGYCGLRFEADHSHH
jgi:uncharacterized Zn-finger protein